MNREIAAALFVTRKAVDFHLRHGYQELGVDRERLAEALVGRQKTGGVTWGAGYRYVPIVANGPDSGTDRHRVRRWREPDHGAFAF